MKLFFATFSVLLLLPLLALAQEVAEFVPLIGIPGLTDPSGYTTELYINILYVLAISIAAFLAVIKLILAGLKYMLTDVVPQKEGAKQDIRTALIGLFIVLTAVLILSTINPQLTNLTALDTLDGISTAVLTQRVETVPSVTNTDIPCTALLSDDGMTIYNCTAAEADCEDVRGGVAIRNESTVTCRVANFTNAQRAAACNVPQGCEQEICPILRTSGIFTGCTGWCNAQSNSTYSPETEICLYQNEAYVAGEEETREAISCLDNNFNEFSGLSSDCTNAITACGDRRHVDVGGDFIYCFTATGSTDEEQSTLRYDVRNASNQGYLAQLSADVNRSFTINEPAIPEAEIPQGELHNTSIRISPDQEGACGDPTLSRCTSARVILPDQTTVVWPCGLLTPKPQSCG